MKAAKTIISRFLQVCLFFMLIVPLSVISCEKEELALQSPTTLEQRNSILKYKIEKCVLSI